MHEHPTSSGGGNLRLRLLPPLLAPLLACVCASPGCDSTPAAAEAAERFDQDRAWGHLETLVALGPRQAGTKKLEEARLLIEAELTSYGLKPVRESFRNMTPIGELDFANVYADIEGEPDGDRPPPIVVICTHIDTKRLGFTFVGANDAGSGTAILLELARSLAATERRGQVTWRILFLDGEEAILPDWNDPDNRYGSRYHVDLIKDTGLLKRVRACVLIDLCGDRDLRFQRELNSDPLLLGFFFDAAKQAGLKRHVNGVRLQIKDDHLSFMAADIPSVDLIDFSYGPNNEYWHSEQDTLDKCSAASLGVTGRIVLLGLPALEEWVLGRG